MIDVDNNGDIEIVVGNSILCISLDGHIYLSHYSDKVKATKTLFVGDDIRPIFRDFAAVAKAIDKGAKCND